MVGSLAPSNHALVFGTGAGPPVKSRLAIMILLRVPLKMEFRLSDLVISVTVRAACIMRTESDSFSWSRSS